MIKRQVEEQTSLKACVVYGSLPPETRSQQADLFNGKQSGFDILVASDAVGMGLNLNIARIVFTQLRKFDGTDTRRLFPAEAQQIAGRAGRFGSDFPSGKVTTLVLDDMPDLVEVLETPVQDVQAAGLFPSHEVLKMVATMESGCLVRALEVLAQEGNVEDKFFLTSTADIMALAQLLQAVDLDLDCRLTFCLSPVSVSDVSSAAALLTYATVYAMEGVVRGDLLPQPPMKPPTDENQLKRLEAQHRVFELYLWLHQRMPRTFPDAELALASKELTGACIAEGLQLLGCNPRARSGRKIYAAARRRLGGFADKVACAAETIRQDMQGTRAQC